MNKDYTFTMKICDNEIDQDNERFSSNCLDRLAQLFIGKAGYIGDSQLSKIVFVEVVEEEDRWATTHEHYKWLKATATIPRTCETEELIWQIELGERYKVNIGCAVNTQTCSICGNTDGRCNHKPGKYYGGALCYTTLDDPTQVYEWSFVNQEKKVSNLNNPRICEILGVEIGEEFTYPGMSCSFRITESGFIKCSDGDIKMCVPTLINFPEKIIHLPHWTTEEMNRAQNLLETIGDGELKQVGDMTTLKVDGKIIYLRKGAFPTLKPERSATLSSIAKV